MRSIDSRCGRLRLPGSELREALAPTYRWSRCRRRRTTHLTVEGFYQLEWEETVLDPVGSFFSVTNDVAGPGARRGGDQRRALPAVLRDVRARQRIRRQAIIDRRFSFGRAHPRPSTRNLRSYTAVRIRSSRPVLGTEAEPSSISTPSSWSSNAPRTMSPADSGPVGRRAALSRGGPEPDRARLLLRPLPQPPPAHAPRTHRRSRRPIRAGLAAAGAVGAPRAPTRSRRLSGAATSGRDGRRLPRRSWPRSAAGTD